MEALPRLTRHLPRFLTDRSRLLGLLNQSQSRRPGLHNGDLLSLGPCPLDLSRRILRRDGGPLGLTSRQFDCLPG